MIFNTYGGGGGSTTTKVIQGITISTDGWIDETVITGLYRYRIESSEIKENMRVNIYFNVTDYTDETPSSLVNATNSGVLAATTADVGYVDVYTTSIPDVDLTCDLELIKIKVVSV